MAVNDRKTTIVGGTGGSKTVDVESAGSKELLAIGVFDSTGAQVDSFGGGGGDATAANQVLQLTQETSAATSLSSIDTKISNLATSAKQDTGNASLASLDGKVTACDTSGLATQTTLAAINAKMVTGTDIGDVTINNGAGAAAVSIQDGGNTITVDGTVTASQGTPPWTMDLTKVAGDSVQVANGTADKSIRVTVASDSTGQIKLAAGTNGIGKLTANSGVDIGDVDVTSTSIDKSINGSGAPTVTSYTSAAISAAADTLNQSVVAAQGVNTQIWVYHVTGTADTGDGTIAFQDEDDTAITGAMAVAEMGGFSIGPSGNYSMPLFKVATNKALEIDTVTCGFKGIISYAVVSV